MHCLKERLCQVLICPSTLVEMIQVLKTWRLHQQHSSSSTVGVLDNRLSAVAAAIITEWVVVLSVSLWLSLSLFTHYHTFSMYLELPTKNACAAHLVHRHSKLPDAIKVLVVPNDQLIRRAECLWANVHFGACILCRSYVYLKWHHSKQCFHILITQVIRRYIDDHELRILAR